MKKSLKSVFKNKLLFSVKDFLIMFLIMGLTVCVGLLFRYVDDATTFISPIFLLSVVLVSRFTNGYIYGILFSIFSVLTVNYIFTYPYFEVDFSAPGYPFAFLCFLFVSIITCTSTIQIKEQKKILLEAEKEKVRSNLLRAISHDLRTPLTSIIGSSSAILENYDALGKKKRLELLQGVKDDAQWLIRMVENLLSITRIDAEEAKIHKEYQAVEEIVGEAVLKFKKSFRNQTVTVSVPDELVLVPVDAILIEQVIINLLENSVKHSECTDAISIVVTTQGEEVVFEVSDKGKGISEEVIPHLFDGYVKNSENIESDSTRNMGIGLSVCMSIIKAHGGTMTAENNKHAGATFTFKLPLKEDAQNEQ